MKSTSRRRSGSSRKPFGQGHRIADQADRAVVGELIDTEKVVALIGEITTDRTLAAAPLAQERGIPPDHSERNQREDHTAGNYVFRLLH